MKKRIAVFGSALDFTDQSVALAEAVGRLIVRSGFTLVTGATSGLPYFAGKAAMECGGTVLGVSPASNAEEHVTKYNRPIDGCTEIFWTGVGFTIRNAINVKNCEAAVIIGGAIGTLQEFSAAYAEGKVIGVLTSSGGISDILEGVVKCCKNHGNAEVIFSDEPTALIDQIGALLDRRLVSHRSS